MVDLNKIEVYTNPRNGKVSVYGPNSVNMLETLEEKGTMLCVLQSDGGYRVLAPRI